MSIPAKQRKALGIERGGTVVATVQDGEPPHPHGKGGARRDIRPRRTGPESIGKHRRSVDCRSAYRSCPGGTGISGVSQRTANLGQTAAVRRIVNVILDSSALLARLLNEPGGDVVMQAIASGAAMSSVNLAEVMTILVRDGLPPAEAERALAKLPVTIHAFDDGLALQAGAMFPVTRKSGMSLGDRACLALAQRERLPALTGDRAWVQAGPLLGVTVRLIR